MTDKRERLEEIKGCHQHDPFSNIGVSWLITELEAAWAEVERLNKVSEGWHQESERYRRCAEAAEKRVKRMEEALERIHGIADLIREEGGELGVISRRLDAALSPKQMEEKE